MQPPRSLKHPECCFGSGRLGAFEFKSATYITHCVVNSWPSTMYSVPGAHYPAQQLSCLLQILLFCPNSSFSSFFQIQPIMPIAHPVYVLANYNLSAQHGAHTESLSANASRILQPDRFTFQTANGNPTSNQQNVALAIICIFPIMAFFMVSLRIYSRTRARQIWIGMIQFVLLHVIPTLATVYLPC